MCGCALLLAGVDDTLAYAVLRHRARERLIGVVHDEADDARDDLAIVLVCCGERDLLALVGVGTLLRGAVSLLRMVPPCVVTEVDSVTNFVPSMKRRTVVVVSVLPSSSCSCSMYSH